VQRRWQAISRRERRALRAFARRSPDAGLRCRCKIVLSLVQDNKPATIHKVMRCSESQVYRVAQRFIEEGLPGLADRRDENGDAKVSDSYETLLLVAVACSPQHYGYRRPTWTQELLIKVLLKETGIRISRTTMSRLLKRLKVRLGRPKPIVGCPWKKARRTRRLNVLRRLVHRLPRGEVVVYVDEVDIHLNPKIGPDYMLQGLQKKVLTPGKNEKRYLAGALDAHSGQLIWVEGERKTSDIFIALLWRLAKEYPTARRIHVILDNYKIHKSQRVGLAMSVLSERITLHFLPPYCPDDNRIERTWKDLHDNVTRNHCCATMEELMKEVRYYLRNRRRSLRRQATKARAA
jgi:transposase